MYLLGRYSQLNGSKSLCDADKKLQGNRERNKRTGHLEPAAGVKEIKLDNHSAYSAGGRIS
jgi:hypothetical protein